jgi:hypothetical protein
MITRDLTNDFELVDAQEVYDHLSAGYTYGSWLLDYDDIRELASNDADGNEGLTDDEYMDVINETLDDMINIGRISKQSLLGQLLKLYSDDDSTSFNIRNMRSVVELSDAYYTVHGTGYAIFTDDIMGGNEQAIAFYNWLGEKDYNRVVEVYIPFM